MEGRAGLGRAKGGRLVGQQRRQCWTAAAVPARLGLGLQPEQHHEALAALLLASSKACAEGRGLGRGMTAREGPAGALAESFAEMTGKRRKIRLAMVVRRS
jgi:hypothetical protein